MPLPEQLLGLGIKGGGPGPDAVSANHPPPSGRRLLPASDRAGLPVVRVLLLQSIGAIGGGNLGRSDDSSHPFGYGGGDGAANNL